MQLKQLQKENGFALPFALVSIVVLSLLMGVYLQVLTHELQVNNDIVRQWKGKYAAESGLDNALYNIKQAVYNSGNAYTGPGDFVIKDNLPSDKHIPDVFKAGGQSSYNWTITGENSLNTGAEIETHRITLQSVGTYLDPNSGRQTKYTVTETFDVMFEPSRIPYSPVSISPVSYSQSIS